MGNIRVFFKEYHPIVYTLSLGTVVTNLVNSMCVPFFAIYLAAYTS